MFKDILLTFLGFCGALCIAKIQERDSAMMQIKFQLIDELIAIDERLHADFAKGEISDKCRNMIKRFRLHLLAYCNSRKFCFVSNKMLIAAWNDFENECFKKNIKPISLYNATICHTPENLGLCTKINTVLELLY